MSESLNLKGYILTADIEKAFDSLSHSFILVCFKKFVYENDFTKWLKCCLNAKSLASLMEVIRQYFLNFKKVLDKVIQFPCFSNSTPYF